MLKISVKGKQSVAKVLPAGEHKVTIKSIEFVEHASDNGAWKDATPKLQVKFGNANGTIIGNFFLKGYKAFEELNATEKKNCTSMSSSFGAEGYAVDKKSGMRIEDEEKTSKAMEILGRLVGDAGLVDEEFDNIDDLKSALENKEIGVVVRHAEKQSNDGSKTSEYMEVAYTKPADKVKETSASSASELE